MNEGWTGVPLELVSDLEHGGRWVSLRAGGREWLWTNPNPATAEDRLHVAPGGPFVDAGGVEECFPTVRGTPDHGGAWSRRWSGVPARVEVPGQGVLSRAVQPAADSLRIDYVVIGRPGTPFLHAVHMLLDLSERARLQVDGVQRALVLDPETHWVRWPGGLDRLGPDDGTAVCALLPGCRSVTVLDGDHALDLAWTAGGQDEWCSLLLWRNLRGYPPDAPYRSVGIEPMVGRAADLRSGDCPHLDDAGRFAWRLTLRSRRRRA